jgi:hypothetical protein
MSEQGSAKEQGRVNAPEDDTYSDEEAARRRDEVVRQMIRMPPKPRKPIPPKGKTGLASTGRVHEGNGAL